MTLCYAPLMAKWRYYYVIAEPMSRPAANKLIAQRGPVLLDDVAAANEIAQWMESLQKHGWPRAMRDEYGRGNVYSQKVLQYDWTGSTWVLSQTTR